MQSEGGRKEKNRKASSKMIQLPANESDFEVSDDGTCELCGTDNPGKWISCDICNCGIICLVLDCLNMSTRRNGNALLATIKKSY